MAARVAVARVPNAGGMTCCLIRELLSGYGG